MLVEHIIPLEEESDSYNDSPKRNLISDSRVEWKLSKSVMDTYLPYKGDFGKNYNNITI